MNGIHLAAVSIGFVAILLLLVYSSCHLIANQATENAKKEHQAILSGKPSTEPFPSRATLLVTNPAKGFETYSGHLIQTSATHCALYDKERGAMVFPLASVSRIEIIENKADGSRSVAEKK